MKKKIIHKLVYRYEIQVSLCQHLICLKPRSNIFQKLSNFDIKILPDSNSTFSENEDDTFKVYFNEPTDLLVIKQKVNKNKYSPRFI